MTSVEKLFGSAVAGAVALVAVFLLLNPLLEAFTQLAKQIAFPVTLVVALLLIGIAATIFQKMSRGR